MGLPQLAEGCGRVKPKEAGAEQGGAGSPGLVVREDCLEERSFVWREMGEPSSKRAGRGI